MELQFPATAYQLAAEDDAGRLAWQEAVAKAMSAKASETGGPGLEVRALGFQAGTILLLRILRLPCCCDGSCHGSCACPVALLAATAES